MKMVFVLAFCCFIFGAGKCQGKLPHNESFVIIDHQVFDLFSNGELKIFDIDKEIQIDKNLTTAFNIDFIAKDKDNNLLASTVPGTLMKFDKNNLSWEDVTPSHFKKNYGFVINSAGKCFEIVVDGVNDATTGEVYTPGKEFCFSEHRLSGGRFEDWDKQDKVNYFIDSKDNLWFTVSYGEWGSDMFVFNTTSHHFIKPTGEMPNLVGFVFEGSENVYCRGGGVRYEPFSQFGFLARFDTTPNDTSGYNIKCQTIYNTLNNKGHDDLMRSQRSMYPNDYIGNPAFNPLDKNIYFFCVYGFYKGNPLNPLTDISHWEKIKSFKLQPKDIKPRIHNYWGTPGEKQIDTQEDYDTSMPYGVQKIGFTNDGKLVFISWHDGLGVFDGNKITILDSSSSY